MKRSLSLVLALVTVVSAFCSCNARVEQPKKVTSSTTAAEEYLSERLGDGFNKDIVLGTAKEAEAYGIDLSSLRDEGYVIRTFEDDTVIFGKTEEGLDRAVRYYAKNCADLGKANVTYGEGYRVKKIEIGGVDISEFDIYLFPEADECHTVAAEELQLYIEKACGIRLDIVRKETERMIVLEQVLEDDERYETLGDEGFTIAVREDGNLYITGGKWRGCLYGVYEFLEAYIGWRFVTNIEVVDEITTDSYFVYEADLIEIPVGTEDTQVPSFAYRQGRFKQVEKTKTTSLGIMHKENDTIRKSSVYNGYGFGKASNHGLLRGPIQNGYLNLDIVSEAVIKGQAQPCFTDEYVIEACIDYYTDDIEKQLALGYEIGKEITYIDVAQNDNDKFCACKNCYEYIKLDRSNTGPVLYFVNTLAEHFGNEYPGLLVSMFAYWGTTKPPKKTVPLDNVIVTYCFYNDIEKLNCYNHPTSGEYCRPEQTYKYDFKIHNTEYAEEFEGWCEISSKVAVWYYPGNWYFAQMPVSRLKTIREDINYFYEQGAYGVYPCMSSGSSDVLWDIQEYLICYLLLDCQWDADMTEDEYWALVEEYLTIFYGEGSTFIMDYFRWQMSASVDECWTVQVYSSPANRLQLSKVCEDFETCISFFENALYHAESSYQEEGIVLLSRSMYLAGLVACHDSWYLNAEQKARYTEIYNEFKKIALETNFSIDEHILVEEDFDINVNLAELFYGNSYVEKNWWNWAET